MRGLDNNFIEKLKQSTLYNLLSDKTLFLGIRNNKINLYYMGASIASIDQNMQITVANKYLDSDSESGYTKISNISLLLNIDKIKNKICNYQIKNQNFEKISQQTLVLNNNQNPNAKWYCVDIEYIMERNNRQEDLFGRFDIVAISKEKINGKYVVALIELKYGCGAYGGFNKFFTEEFDQTGKFDITTNMNVGSGILGHVCDYVRYLKSDNFNKVLKHEIVNTLHNLNALGVYDEFQDITVEDIHDEPQIYFITLHDDGNCKKQMKKYLLKFKGASKYNVETILGTNITTKNDLINPIFLFSKDNGKNIHDIINDASYSKL